MKTAFLLFFILMLYAVSGRTQSPPPQIKGQGDSSYQLPKPNIQVPNKTATNLGGLTTLIETGNKNLLSNPSAEHATYSTDWNLTGTATFSAETSNVFYGAKAIKAVTSSQTFNIYQVSTLTASQKSGVQCLAQVWIRSTHTGIITVYPVVNGTSQPDLGVTVNANDGWGLYKIPFICGGTSNGIEIDATSGTGTTYIDDAFVGAVDIKTDVDQSRIAGEVIFESRDLSPNCEWAVTSTTLAAFTSDADCAGPTVLFSSMGEWQSTDYDLPKVGVNSLPPGVYKATFYFRSSMSATGNSFFSINDGTTTCRAVFGETATTSGVGVASCIFNYQSSGNRVFQLYGGSASGTVTVSNTTVTGSDPGIKFQLEYFGNNQIYSASCGANCVDTFSARVSSTGEVSNENLDFISDCSVSSGTYTCPIVTSKLVLSTKLNCTATAIGVTRILHYDVVTSSISQIVFKEASTTGSVNDTGFSIICQKQGTDFVATRTIVGSFKEVVTAPGITKPKTCYYAFGGAGTALAPTACTSSPCTEYYDSCNAVSSAPTRSGAGVYPFSFQSGTFANSTVVECNGMGVFKVQPAFQNAVTGSNASGGLDVTIYTISNGGGTQTATDSYPVIACKGAAP